MKGWWRFIVILSFQTISSEMSTAFFFRPLRAYDDKEYHAFSGSLRPGLVRWTGRDTAYFKQFAPIPDSVADRTLGYVATFATQETLNKIWPSGSSRDNSDYIFIGSPIIKNYSDGKITIKAALRHRTTDIIVLLTGTNTKPEKESTVASVTEGWFSYNADMVAPAIFWDNLLANI
jgi:hypothetical protein